MIQGVDMSMVSNPPHYDGDGKITCMDALKSMLSGIDIPPIAAYWWGCAFKYTWRHAKKNGAQDIDKAIQCLTYLKEELYGVEND